MIDFGFKIGDKVITYDFIKGKIEDICYCERCKERGFYEPTIKLEDGSYDYISIYQAQENFPRFYKIGKHIFGNVADICDLENREKELVIDLKQIRKSIKRIKELKGKVEDD